MESEGEVYIARVRQQRSWIHPQRGKGAKSSVFIPFILFLTVVLGVEWGRGQDWMTFEEEERGGGYKRGGGSPASGWGWGGVPGLRFQR